MFGRRRNRQKFEASEDHSVARNISLILAGIGIGSGIALLASPRSGEEIRHAIGRRYLKTIKRLGRSTEGLRDRVEDLLEHASDLRGSRVRRFLRRRAIKRLLVHEAERRLRAA
jgi:hypothetical protein